MTIDRFLLVSVAAIGCAAAAFAVLRHKRWLEKQQIKEDLRIWEDEGGNLAPAASPAAPPKA